VIRWTYAFIDRPAERFEAAHSFWTAVTDTHLSAPRGEHGEFATLLPLSSPSAAEADPCLKIQAVGDEGGAHLDLSVEDVPALKRSALSLGAELVLDEGDFAVLRSPGGQLFCGVTWHGEKVRPAAAVGPGGARTRLDQVCIDLAPGAFDAEVSFWAALTGWESYTGSQPEFHVLHPPAGLPIRVLLQRLADDRPTRSLLDLSCTDVDAARAWHESCGATLVDRLPRWTVMRDPAGGTYCLTGRDPDTGRRAS
jgi:hypothetical protein